MHQELELALCLQELAAFVGEDADDDAESAGVLVSKTSDAEAGRGARAALGHVRRCACLASYAAVGPLLQCTGGNAVVMHSPEV